MLYSRQCTTRARETYLHHPWQGHVYIQLYSEHCLNSSDDLPSFLCIALARARPARVQLHHWRWRSQRKKMLHVPSRCTTGMALAKSPRRMYKVCVCVLSVGMGDGSHVLGLTESESEWGPQLTGTWGRGTFVADKLHCRRGGTVIVKQKPYYLDGLHVLAWSSPAACMTMHGSTLTPTNAMLLVGLMRDLNVPLSPTQLAQAIAQLDPSSSGKASFGEFLLWWKG